MQDKIEDGAIIMIGEEEARDLVDGLQKIFDTNILQIILYGSVARREETSESDIDIAIIVQDDCIEQVFDRFMEWNAKLDMKYGRVFSIIDIERSKMDKWGSILPFYRNIKEEGIVLWKAA